MRQTLSTYLSNFVELFYPHICLSCGEKLLTGEEVICLNCEAELPQANHYNNPNNPLVQRLWGRVPVQGAMALFQFQKSENLQELLHQLKYRQRKEVSHYMGNVCAHLLQQPDAIIKNVDIVVPVPLHWKRLQTRGYNQCSGFAENIAKGLGVEWSETALERVIENESQTKINRFDRWQNVANIFAVSDPGQLKGKHVLVVDDVVTTGATAEACLQTVLTVPGTTVSFAAMAVALR